ncbi:MAG: inositol monophosphatase family protein [Terricaulis sp.]
MQSAESDLALLEEAVREAGGLVRELLAKPLDIKSKGDAGPVTNVDFAVNTLLHERLRAARPDYGWLSEETPDDHADRIDKKDVFVLDPIDGTAAMIAHVPQFTISIGICEDGRAAAGAIYNPMTDELYLGAPGEGATRNGVPIRASLREELEGARMIGQRKTFTNRNWAKPWPTMDIISRQSIAYRLALVAAAQADAVILFGLKHEWDIAAGVAIVAAARGRITDLWGAPLRFNQPDPRAPGAVASGALLHALILERTSRLPDPRTPQAEST